MSNIKEFNVKLRSLRNTEKMTRTMKLVAMSKLYRAQEAQRNAKLYVEQLTNLSKRLAASVENASHPLLVPYKKVNNVLILLLTSDRGLCAGFNNNLSKAVYVWVKECKDKYQKIDVSFCGKRGAMFFKNVLKARQEYKNVTGRPDFTAAKKIAHDLIDDFLAGRYEEVYLAHNAYHSPLSQAPVFDKILPIEPQALIEGGTKISSQYIFEPAEKEMLDVLIPKYLCFRIFFALLENSAGEHGARMTAMDSASKNAADLIDHYTLLRNRARQAAITTELIEIVSGAEALK